jgi:hypothetical protein
MVETVYIETTILSYLVSRRSRDIIVAARQELTRQWWECSKSGYDCVLSQIVLDEIEAGDPTHAAKRMDQASNLGVLAVNQACMDLAQLYLNRGYVPQNEIRDALHIAVAVIWKVDYLLTWNCKHIANAHSLRQLRKFSENLGYEFPHVCTPEEL